MNRILSLAVLAGCTSFAAAQDENISGTYHLRVSDEIVNMARTMGQPTPDGALLLGPDGVFELTYHTVTVNYHRFGRYSVEGQNIVFHFRNRNREFQGTVANGRVTVNGLEYRREGWRPRMHRDWPGSVSIVNHDVFSPDPNPVKFPHPDVAPPLPPAVVLPEFDAIGTWSVRNKGTEDIDSKMTFDRDGNFSFSGHGAKSKGHYKVHDGVITLTWTQIDDDRVEEGTVTKDVPICSDHIGFDIDTYHYERCSKQN